MLEDLKKELGAITNELKNSLKLDDETVTLTVAKPYCSPARNIITGALKPYGVKIHGIEETVVYSNLAEFARRMEIEAKTFENLKFGPLAVVFLPMAIQAKVKVNRRAAAWAEYLMLRTGRLYIVGEYFEPRNEEWANKHNGKMPPQWGRGEPWIESMCSKGVEKWKEIRNAVKQAEKRKEPTIKDKIFRRW